MFWGTDGLNPRDSASIIGIPGRIEFGKCVAKREGVDGVT